MRTVKLLRPSAFLASTALIAAFATEPALRLQAATPHLCTTAKGAGGPTGYGTVHFANSCTAAVQPALQLAIAKLHSFEADPGEFTAVSKRDPVCAIAWWGAAMSARGNPLGGSLGPANFEAGRVDVRRAKAALANASTRATQRERDLVAAIDTYYQNYPDQIARGRAYAVKMDAAHAAYPDDPDIAALDGLAIIEGVDLNDKTFSRQKRAGAILAKVMASNPENPGAPHYMIHAYDYTALAPEAIHAAEVESQISPASSHAQHMPSHIWSMVGAWDKSIAANRRSDVLADPSAGSDPVKDDIVYGHAFDFIAYARLQKGEDTHVGADLAAARTTGDGMPTVILARYALERDDWHDATKVPVPTNDAFDAALARFARAYGAARAGDVASARNELDALRALRPKVVAGAGAYWGQYVGIYGKAAEAWILKDEGHADAALAAMRDAADRDDNHEKHIYLENKILPMRESLGDMELALGHPRDALVAYEGSLQLAPNRYRSFLGAAEAARACGDMTAAKNWSGKLVALAKDGDKARPGWRTAEAILGARVD